MRAIFAAVAVIALLVVWQVTPLSTFADPEAVISAMISISNSPWSPVVVLASFLTAGLIAFPVTLLVIAIAATFGPWLGLAYSGIGLIASATVTYAVGKWLGREIVTKATGSRLDFLRNRGVLAVALVRAVPIAPFAVASLIAGASGIRLLDYLAGTALGVAPALLVLCVLGHQIFRTLADPSPVQIALLAGAMALWLAAAIGVQKLLARTGQLS